MCSFCLCYAILSNTLYCVSTKHVYFFTYMFYGEMYFPTCIYFGSAYSQMFLLKDKHLHFLFRHAFQDALSIFLLRPGSRSRPGYHLHSRCASCQVDCIRSRLR
uniref:Putative transmembrane protein n=1 Tax=Toxoplasma gondii TgCATBr9 TaxID=943120 RepID=A0A2T6ISA6_TOXGO|nr:putative transmembrane protein [Toxoplasma gondii TgCATBr9]